MIPKNKKEKENKIGNKKWKTSKTRKNYKLLNRVCVCVCERERQREREKKRREREKRKKENDSK